MTSLGVVTFERSSDADGSFIRAQLRRGVGAGISLEGPWMRSKSLALRALLRELSDQRTTELETFFYLGAD